MLRDIVSQTQGAFISEMSIISNILICQYLAKRFGKSRNQVMGLLMMEDLKKAYDYVEWDFIQELLEALNLPNHFIKCITASITTHKFTLLRNGNTEGFFEAKIGVRPGDPMSLLIFFLYLNYLTRILNYVSELPEFKFFKGD